MTGSGSNIQWQNAAGSSTTQTITSGGNTYNANYYKQLQNTYSANANTPTTFSASITFGITGTSLAVGSSLHHHPSEKA